MQTTLGTMASAVSDYLNEIPFKEILTVSVEVLVSCAIVACLVCAFLRFRLMRRRCTATNRKPSIKFFFKPPEYYEAVTSKDRGTPSERELISIFIEKGIKPTAIYHDLLIQCEEGRTSQVDLVVMTKVGLVVVEVKDYKGIILGNGKLLNWTVVYLNKENSFIRTAKRSFYNPFKQNSTHIKALQNIIGDSIPMFSLVVFSNNGILKDVSIIPSNGYLATTSSAMRALNSIVEGNPTYQYDDAWGVANKLKEMSESGGAQSSQAQHIDNVTDYVGYKRIFK